MPWQRRLVTTAKEDRLESASQGGHHLLGQTLQTLPVLRARPSGLSDVAVVTFKWHENQLWVHVKSLWSAHFLPTVTEMRRRGSPRGSRCEQAGTAGLGLEIKLIVEGGTLQGKNGRVVGVHNSIARLAGL